MFWLIFLRLFIILLIIFDIILKNECFIQRNIEITASKGKFMIHMLHSAYFFPQTVNVKWLASAQGKPKLPVWLHLFTSKHHAISYLIGTPVTPFSRVIIHVIAKRLDNYQSAEQFITIKLNEDVRFNMSTQQIVGMRIKNIEAEDFFNPRDDNLKKLEKSIHETFRGNGVNPYIFNIFPEIPSPPKDFYKIAPKYKIASIVQIGTQRNFHNNVHKIVDGLDKNKGYCSKNSYIPMDKNFRHTFEIDWCKFNIKKMTMNKSLKIFSTGFDPFAVWNRSNSANELQVEKGKTRKTMENNDAIQKKIPLRNNSIFETVLVFPLLAVLCIMLILILSIIFFGRREGQHWRDYKTPKERLQEYLDVRESQRQLRELSVQRQILFMSSEHAKSELPVNINTFLQPRQPIQQRQSQLLPPNSPYQPSDRSLIRMPLQPRNVLNASQSRLPTSSPVPLRQRSARCANSSITGSPAGLGTSRSSVGKQTVAEAALATGSSLYLYRNTLDNEDSDEKEEFNNIKKNTGHNTWSKNYNPHNKSLNNYNDFYATNPRIPQQPRQQTYGMWSKNNASDILYKSSTLR